MLKGKKILLGISGSIAAYKSAVLVRYLVREGAEVKVVMTPAAKDFTTPLTLATLSKQPVSVEISKEDQWDNHVLLGRWADIMLVAPLSCNTLAKMAGGFCDNLLLAVYLSATCPVMLAPAMDEDMWKHASTRRNLQVVSANGNIIVPVTHGELASGLTGEGRMAEPETIVEELIRYFSQNDRLRDKKVLVTAGPTYEHIDPVRFIGNHSSGKMGIAIAREFANCGASVTLVLGPVSTEFSLGGMEVVRVNTAEEMYNACHRIFEKMDITVMAAAVADYTPVVVSSEKIKKKEDSWSVELTKTPDILKSLGHKKTGNQVLAGFALETNSERENALAKLRQKNADIIFLNSLRDEGAGFGKDTNKITVLDRRGGEINFEMKSKTDVAKDIVDCIINFIHA